MGCYIIIKDLDKVNIRSLVVFKVSRFDFLYMNKWFKDGKVIMIVYYFLMVG